MRSGGTPVLFFNRRPLNVDAFGVTCDNVGGGRLVADHLIKLGHRRLAFVAGRPDASTTVDRWEGYRRGCLDHGLKEPICVEAGAFAYELGYKAAFRLLGSGAPVRTGCSAPMIFSPSASWMRARREFGLDIPGDLSVVGFDDIAMARWPSHALTTVRQPVGKMIDVTMQLIEMLFDSAQLKPRIERLPGELIERASTQEVTMPSSGRDMLDRAALVHRWDCPAVAAEPALPEPDVAEADAAAAAVLRRPYDALRRLIGQAAGLLVLAQASQRREIVDLPGRRRCARAMARSDRDAW